MNISIINIIINKKSYYYKQNNRFFFFFKNKLQVELCCFKRLVSMVSLVLFGRFVHHDDDDDYHYNDNVCKIFNFLRSFLFYFVCFFCCCYI